MKKYHTLPLILLAYLIGMAIFTYPGREGNEELSFAQYYATVGVVVVVIIATYFFQKKKYENNEKYKNNRKNKEQ
ncbi:Mn2+/Fe2+ NRAMP family transporter [Dysgonomonadaceae bacterium PH5-43]|nr:Mn2+/Fe2+ NRAMP family transporter [Dysgonomonadaceae bacterium PH5-43]